MDMKVGSFFLLASRQSSAKVASPKATEVAQQFTASVAPKAFIRHTPHPLLSPPSFTSSTMFRMCPFQLIMKWMLGLVKSAFVQYFYHYRVAEAGCSIY